MSDCHTSTGEWQHFEARMRRRRADRCLLRASAALDAEATEAAETVLAEAESLCPEHPGLKDVNARLQSSIEPVERAAPIRWLPVMLALTLLSLFGAAGW